MQIGEHKPGAQRETIQELQAGSTVEGDRQTRERRRDGVVASGERTRVCAPSGPSGEVLAGCKLRGRACRFTTIPHNWASPSHGAVVERQGQGLRQGWPRNLSPQPWRTSSEARPGVLVPIVSEVVGGSPLLVTGRGLVGGHRAPGSFALGRYNN